MRNPGGAMSSRDTAYLGNDGRYTVFRYGDQRLKFIAPYSLERYMQVKEWDNGYLVVLANSKAYLRVALRYEEA